jgi:PDZ domain-containing protein
VAIFDERDPTRIVQQRSKTVGWLMLAFTAVVTLALASLPAPYVIDHPGPTYDTLGVVTTSGGELELITIAGAPVYDTSGELRLTTVTRSGNPESLPGWFDVITGLFDPTRTVIPVDVAYPPGVSLEQNREAARLEMQTSQQESIAAALSHVGISFSSTLVVSQAMEGGPSEGVLFPGDVIVSAAGEKITNVTQLREVISVSGVMKPLTLAVDRAGDVVELEVRPRMSEGANRMPMIGILVSGHYEFPLEIGIALENVGGPSAGLMFALGVVDKLTPGEVTGGLVVAGTGTISAAGEIGSIGGVRHKMHGAKKDGAEVFLAPAGNCGDILGHEPDGLLVIPVATLADAIEALESYRNGEAVARCQKASPQP